MINEVEKIVSFIVVKKFHLKLMYKYENVFCCDFIYQIYLQSKDAHTETAYVFEKVSWEIS